VTEEVPGRPPSGGLVQALNVPRNAKLGAATGALLAVGVYLFRVLELLGPFAGTRQYPVLGAEGWFLLLAFVLASATALLVTAVLTLVSAYRLAREL
jgi:fucose permease